MICRYWSTVDDEHGNSVDFCDMTHTAVGCVGVEETCKCGRFEPKEILELLDNSAVKEGCWADDYTEEELEEMRQQHLRRKERI